MPPENNHPYVAGRFNYMMVQKDMAHVIWTPNRENVLFFVARYLPLQEAKDLAAELNYQLNQTRSNIRELQYVPDNDDGAELGSDNEQERRRSNNNTITKDNIKRITDEFTDK